MLVLDASAVLEILLRTERARKIESRIFRKAETLFAPHLLDLEVLQVLRRYAGKDMTEERCGDEIQDFEDLTITIYPDGLFVWRIWEMRNRLTAYDAAYVALAEALRAPLLTCDARLASSQGHSAEIQLIE
jgi:predicted nucleic acid-binding protein